MTGMQFSNLFPELKQMIFSYLPIVDLLQIHEVCSEWAEEAKHKMLWRKLYLSYATDVSTEKVVEFIRRAECNLRELEVVRRRDAGMILATAAEMCPQLRVLKVTDCILSLDLYSTVMKKCSEIQYVTFKGVGSESGQFLMYLLQGKSLKSLKYEDWKTREDYERCVSLFPLRVPPKELLNIIICFFMEDAMRCKLKTCERLTELEIKLYEDHGNMRAFLLQQLVPLRTLKSLKLNFSFSVHTEVATFLSDLPSAGQLETLHLTQCKNVDEHCLKMIASKCQAVTHLNLNYCPNITDFGLQHIIRGCKKLCQLDVISFEYVSGTTRQLIRKHLPKLVFNDKEAHHQQYKSS